MALVRDPDAGGQMVKTKIAGAAATSALLPGPRAKPSLRGGDATWKKVELLQ
jgi:hypothetical protein